jgi:hypothetical protein
MEKAFTEAIVLHNLGQLKVSGTHSMCLPECGEFSVLFWRTSNPVRGCMHPLHDVLLYVHVPNSQGEANTFSMVGAEDDCSAFLEMLSPVPVSFQA